MLLLLLPTPTKQVRTQTLVKNAIVQIDAAPFKQWYQQHYGLELGQKKGEEKAEAAEAKVRPAVSEIQRRDALHLLA